MKTGRIVNGVAAPYNFNISDLYHEAWGMVKGFKKTFWGGFCIYLGICIALLLASVIIEYITKAIVGDGSPVLIGVKNFLGLLRNFIEYPLVVGMLMLGVKRSVNLPVKATNVLSYYKYIWRIIGVAISMMIIIFIPTFIGMLLIFLAANFNFIGAAIAYIVGGLFCAAALYLMISYLFAAVLTAEKKLGIWQSLEISRRAITQHWFKVFFASIGMFVVFILACIPLFIGLIWALPWGYCMWGSLYRTLFGVEGVSQNR